MPILKPRSILGGMKVKEAMQRRFLQLPSTSSLKTCIRQIIKYKANAVLVTQPDGHPGVVSKTDLMGAFYAGLDLDTILFDIMVGSLYSCVSEDPVEIAVERMKQYGIHQLYVSSKTDNSISGLLEYSDIVGLLYRYCRACKKSGRYKKNIIDQSIPRLVVKDVMTPGAVSCHINRSIIEVIEILSEKKMGTILVTNDKGKAWGVISKTDLVLAFAHGVDVSDTARSIMQHPVSACDEDVRLSDAIARMLLFDIQRIFVQQPHTDTVTGVLSLSDATRFRSGTCRACRVGQILDPA